MTVPFFKTWNQLAPVKPEGAPGDPTFGRVLLDFTTAATVEFDLLQEIAANEIGFVQAVYIDNADNATALTMLITPTQHRTIVKARTQGWYYALCGDPAAFRFSTTPGAGIIVPVFFGNVPMAPVQWLTQ